MLRLEAPKHEFRGGFAQISHQTNCAREGDLLLHRRRDAEPTTAQVSSELRFRRGSLALEV